VKAPALSAAYWTTFERTLKAVATQATDLDVPLVPFWPLRGRAYDHELLVIGRSVNGWVDDWTARDLRDATTRHAAVDWLRADAEPQDRDRMAWVSDLWRATTGFGRPELLSDRGREGRDGPSIPR
jgi:hypothetical protein